MSDIHQTAETATSDAAVLETPRLENSGDGINQSDANLLKIWEKHNGPAAEEKAFMKSPPMPPVPEGKDERQAEIDWHSSPLSTRQEIALAHKQFEAMRKAGDGLGVKVETASDIKAVREMMGLGGNKPDADAAKPDPAMLRTFDAVRKIDPTVTNHSDALGRTNDWIEHIATNGVRGWRDVLTAHGVNVTQLLTPQEYTELVGRPPQDTSHLAEPVETVITEWASGRKLSDTDLSEMAAIVQRPDFQPGETSLATLDRAEQLMRRARARHPAARVDSGLTGDLQKIAAKRFGGRRK